LISIASRISGALSITPLQYRPLQGRVHARARQVPISAEDIDGDVRLFTIHARRGHHRRG
jgi:hypothetical protein